MSETEYSVRTVMSCTTSELEGSTLDDLFEEKYRTWGCSLYRHEYKLVGVKGSKLFFEVRGLLEVPEEPDSELETSDLYSRLRTPHEEITSPFPGYTVRSFLVDIQAQSCPSCCAEEGVKFPGQEVNDTATADCRCLRCERTWNEEYTLTKVD